MAIYNQKNNTLYTDLDFVDILEKNNFWKNRDENHLQIRSLNDLAKELGYDFITEIKPNIFLFDTEIVNICKNKSITRFSNLEKHYFEKLPKNIKKPKYLDGILLLKWLKSKKETFKNK